MKACNYIQVKVKYLAIGKAVHNKNTQVKYNKFLYVKYPAIEW